MNQILSHCCHVQQTTPNLIGRRESRECFLFKHCWIKMQFILYNSVVTNVRLQMTHSLSQSEPSFLSWRHCFKNHNFPSVTNITNVSTYIKTLEDTVCYATHAKTCSYTTQSFCLFFFNHFLKHYHIFISCAISLQKDSFHNIKNHVKSSGNTKRLCCFKKKKKNFFVWMKIKALNIASKPLCCKRTQEVVNMWVLLGFWRQRSPHHPVQTVQGLWHLTTGFS